MNEQQKQVEICLKFWDIYLHVRVCFFTYNTRTTVSISMYHSLISSLWSWLDFRLQNIVSVVSIAPQVNYKKLIIFLLLSENFLIKAEGVTLLGLEYSMNSRNLMKIVKAIFEKNKILNFFFMWTTLKGH